VKESSILGWRLFSLSSDEASHVRDAVDGFERTVMIASENGLFVRQSQVGFEEIVVKVESALRCLDASPPDVVKARSDFAKGYDIFNTAVEKAGFCWRLTHAYAVPHFLYLLLVLAVVTYSSLTFKGKLEETFVLVPVWAFAWGALGSVLQGLWWLWNQVSERQFRKHWVAWFLSVPFIGALMGAIMYLAFSAGFVAATKSTIQDNTVPMLLAALAGFAWSWAIGVLNNLTKLFAVGELPSMRS